MQKLLIANRGEIAVRIIRTARELGIRTVAIASEVDVNALHARMADEVVEIGPAHASKSYLDHDRVLDAARSSGADAIHPGYGFLSESSAFARRVLEAGLIWVGPSPDSIDLMGNKSAAILAATKAGVPTIPGTGRPLAADDDLAALGDEIGFPLAVKAAAGGGGRGIRIVHDPEQLAKTVELARAEARAAFGDADVYLERFIANARHVEVQVFGDGENYVHLYGRDCSMQRRHQKVIEEAPVPAMPEDVRARMLESAVELARQTGYVGAGTVEYLYDVDRNEVAFIEMNTRLQVEHPITEMITGRDLVRDQLRVAAGEPLGYTQDDVQPRGHAFEFRVCAEDPAKKFMPSPGDLKELVLPGGPGIRLDFGFGRGDAVAPFYDSLIGKIIVWAPTRAEAIVRSLHALDEARVDGIKTTLPALRALMATDAMAECTHTTTYIENAADLTGALA